MMAKARKSRWEPYIEGVTVLEECRWYWFLIRWVDSKGKWRESVDLYFIDTEGGISTLSDDDGMGASIDTFIGYNQLVAIQKAEAPQPPEKGI